MDTGAVTGYTEAFVVAITIILPLVLLGAQIILIIGTRLIKKFRPDFQLTMHLEEGE